MANNTKAVDLPIYERAIARFPHLASIPDAQSFCFQLCNLASVDSITQQEYWKAGAVANGGEWTDDEAQPDGIPSWKELQEGGRAIIL